MRAFGTSQRGDRVEPRERVEVPARISRRQLEPLHLLEPSLMRAQVTLHVSPFEFLKARFQRVETARRPGQDSRPKLDSQQFAFGLQRGDRQLLPGVFSGASFVRCGAQTGRRQVLAHRTHPRNGFSRSRQYFVCASDLDCRGQIRSIRGRLEHRNRARLRQRDKFLDRHAVRRGHLEVRFSQRRGKHLARAHCSLDRKRHRGVESIEAHVETLAIARYRQPWIESPREHERSVERSKFGRAGGGRIEPGSIGFQTNHAAGGNFQAAQ